MWGSRNMEMWDKHLCFGGLAAPLTVVMHAQRGEQVHGSDHMHTGFPGPNSAVTKQIVVIPPGTYTHASIPLPLPAGRWPRGRRRARSRSGRDSRPSHT